MGRAIHRIFNIKIKLFLPILFLLILFTNNVNSIDDSNTTFINQISNTISASFQDAISKIFYVPLNSLFGLFDKFMDFNIDINSFKESWNLVVSIIIPLFIISIAYNGYYMIFNNNSEYKLYKCKNNLKISIMCLILVSSSFLLYSYFLEFVDSIKSVIFDKSNVSVLLNIDIGSHI